VNDVSLATGLLSVPSSGLELDEDGGTEKLDQLKRQRTIFCNYAALTVGTAFWTRCKAM